MFSRSMTALLVLLVSLLELKFGTTSSTLLFTISTDVDTIGLSALSLVLTMTSAESDFLFAFTLYASFINPSFDLGAGLL